MVIPCTLQELRSKIAAQGNLAAIIAYAGRSEEIWSFTDLAGVSTRAANGLVQRGIGRGSGVAIIAPNSPRWIGAFWAIVAAGATAVPLDLQTNDDELARMLEIAGCRLAFTTSAATQRLATLAPSCRPIILDADNNNSTIETWANLLAQPSVEFPAVTAADEAVILFTSGTTGTPKAVPLTHTNLLTNVNAIGAARLVGRGDRALLPLPLYHAYPLTIGMLTPLALGCGIVLPAGISGPEIVTAMRQGHVTAVVGVPRLYTALLDNMRRGIAAQPFPMSALISTFLAVAGWAKRQGIHWPGRILLDRYAGKSRPNFVCSSVAVRQSAQKSKKRLALSAGRCSRATGLSRHRQCSLTIFREQPFWGLPVGLFPAWRRGSPMRAETALVRSRCAAHRFFRATAVIRQRRGKLLLKTAGSGPAIWVQSTAKAFSTSKRVKAIRSCWLTVRSFFPRNSKRFTPPRLSFVKLLCLAKTVRSSAWSYPTFRPPVTLALCALAMPFVKGSRLKRKACQAMRD